VCVCVDGDGASDVCQSTLSVRPGVGDSQLVYSCKQSMVIWHFVKQCQSAG
jgi:hypothetical protein